MASSKKFSSSIVSEAYLSNEKSLSRFLRRFLDRPEDVQDALHDTYLKAYQAEERSPITSARALLFKIAKNVAINEKARHGNSRTDTVAEFDHLGAGQFGQRDETEVQATADQQLECAMQAIESMTPRVRDVFVLRKVHGYRQKEVAKQLNISESTVEKHLARGVEIVMRFKSNRSTGDVLHLPKR